LFRTEKAQKSAEKWALGQILFRGPKILFRTMDPLKLEKTRGADPRGQGGWVEGPNGGRRRGVGKQVTNTFH
jgi:hypothetical protein